MLKSDLIKAVAGECGFSQKDVSLVVNSVFENIKKAAKDGDVVQISDFGKFAAPMKEARVGRNPNTGEEIQIPAKRAFKFSASASVKRMMAE